MRVFKKALAEQEAELTNAILSYDDNALNEIIFTESDVLEKSAEEDGLDDDSQAWLDARDMQHDMLARLVNLNFKLNSALLVADMNNGFFGWVISEDDYDKYINGLIKEYSDQTPESIKAFHDFEVAREAIEDDEISLTKALKILASEPLGGENF